MKTTHDHTRNSREHTIINIPNLSFAGFVLLHPGIERISHAHTKVYIRKPFAYISLISLANAPRQFRHPPFSARLHDRYEYDEFVVA